VTTLELAPHPGETPVQPVEDPPDRSMVDAPLPACESHSSISTYRGCPLRYGFRYVEHRPGEVSPRQFAFGNAVHKAFEVFGRARIRARADGSAEPGAELLSAALDEKLATSGFAPDEVEEARRRAVPVMARFLELEAGTDAEPVAVELGFGVDVALPGEGTSETAVPRAGAVRFVGYVDRVDRAPDGSTEIVDYKTGRPRSQADVDSDAQLTAYAYGCARGGLRDPATGTTLPPASRLGLYFAETGELAWTSRTDEQLDAFEAGLVETVGRIHAREFAARPAHWRCRWCEYRHECPEASPGA
jgi:DNA helicase II / ATP-dependent DNA helicase PcrA